MSSLPQPPINYPVIDVRNPSSPVMTNVWGRWILSFYSRSASIDAPDWATVPRVEGNVLFYTDGDWTSTGAAGLLGTIDLEPGVDVQVQNATLQALADQPGSGIVIKDGDDIGVRELLSTPLQGITILNGDGLSANPQINLDIGGMLRDVAPDITQDYVPVYDFSTGTNVKVLIQDLVGGTSGSSQDAQAQSWMGL